MSREIQTIIINKTVADTRAEAKRIARVHANRLYTTRETNESFRFRQFPPAQCRPGSYATEQRGEGVSIVWCDRRTGLKRV